MFAKLLKHEWRASRGLVGLLCAIIGVSGLLFGGIARYMTWSSVTGNAFMVSVYAVVMAVAVLAIVGCSVGAMYLLVHRFYTSRFTDQGYLLLTLPVTTHQQLLSSIVNTVVGVTLVGITAFASAGVGIGIFLSTFDRETSAAMLQALKEGGLLLKTASGIGGIRILVAVLSLAVMLLADILLLMLAVTVGSQAQKHPVLKGAALYIGVDILLTELNGFLSPWANEALGYPGIGGNAVTALLIYTAAAAVSYFLMHRILDRKLNLI